MTRSDTQARADFWAMKRADTERAARLEQCSHCLDLYEKGTEHHCGSGYNVTHRNS